MDEDPEEPKQYLVAHVREALAADGRLNDLNIDVAVAGQRVFLSGVVATPERRVAVGEVVRELLPSYEVVNETTIGELADASEAEELA